MLTSLQMTAIKKCGFSFLDRRYLQLYVSKLWFKISEMFTPRANCYTEVIPILSEIFPNDECVYF